MTWIGFLVSLIAVLVISRKSLALGLIPGAIILGLFTLPVGVLLKQLLDTITDPNILLLALAMGLVPLIGGTMRDSGQVDDLVAGLHLPRRFLLAFSAALMGLLPMPGGALLSAPILEKAGADLGGNLISAINNWFRHTFILIYPLSPALIVSANIAGIDVYRAIIYVFPLFALSMILGYIFYLRRVEETAVAQKSSSRLNLIVPLAVILSPPVLDFVLKRAFGLDASATLIGVMTGISLSVLFSRVRLNLGDITRRTRPWNFAFIILGMFIYLHVFQKSDAGAMIASLPLPPLLLAVLAGFLLGLATGRVQLPASIIFPVYLGAVGMVTPTVFALIYTSVYFGYIISPVHPCLVVTCEYFRTPVRDVVVSLAAPTMIVVGVVLAISAALML